MSRSRCSADQGKVGKGQTNASGAGALADDDIQGKVLHSGVEDLLDHAGEAVDLIDKEYVILRQIGQDGGQISLLFNSGSRGGAQVDPHLIGNNACESGFAESRRAIEQNVVQGFLTHFRRFDVDLQILLGLLLADIILEGAGAQRIVYVEIMLVVFGGHISVFEVHFLLVHVSSLSEKRFEGLGDDLLYGELICVDGAQSPLNGVLVIAKRAESLCGLRQLSAHLGSGLAEGGGYGRG